MNKYDIIIIGGGPAGLTAALYALRGGASVLLLEKTMVGGQTGRLMGIENFPSYESIDGFDLIMKMHAQATKYGLTTAYEEVVSLTQTSAYYEIGTSSNKYVCQAVIIATGATHISLGFEQPYVGRGAHYCATCDGMFYRGKSVALVGGGKVALHECLYLSGVAEKVYFIYKGDKAKSAAFLQPLADKANVSVLYNLTPQAALGDKHLNGLLLTDNEGNQQTLQIDGLFVSLGTTPLTGFVADRLNNDNGRIIVDADMATSLRGVYACGDCINKKVKQIVTACADGAIAAESALTYLKE